MLFIVVSQTLEDYQKQLEQVNHLIEENEAKIEQLKKEEKGILYELSLLNTKIQLYYEKLDIIRNQIKELSDRIYILNRKREETMNDIETTKMKISKGAVLLYKLPRNDFWQLLLKTGSFYKSYSMEISLFSVLKYYKSLVDNLRNKEEELKLLELELEKNYKKLEIAMDEQRKALSELEIVRNQKEKDLSKIRNYKKDREAYMSELEKSREKLEKIIKELSKPKVAVKSNKPFTILVPVEGEIVGKFGYITDNSYGTRIKNNGIDIKAQRGSPVRAVESGEVVYVGFIEGYGNIIIIEHSGFFSIYSQVFSISVKKGDKVMKGQQIAKASQEPVHFELRIGREAVDPTQYFEGS